MKKFDGIIFDFNGTLVLDDELHFAAFQKYGREDLGLTIEREDYFSNMHGRPNDRIYESIYKKPIPDELKGKFARRKEEYYLESFKKNPPPLANGAVVMLDFLKENRIPCAIATSSDLHSVNFFREVFSLDKWFSHIIYSDGTMRGKPSPDIYLRAGERLGIPMQNLITVEDSLSGAMACKASNAGLVVGICPRGKENFLGKEHTDMVITDFTQFPYKELFKRP